MKTLCVLLVHGTWGSSSEWKNEGSDFRAWLQAGLAGEYAAMELATIEWSGNNRWRAREHARVELTQQLQLRRRGDGGNTEYLVIGHSHGGNIATEAVRDWMKTDKSFPLRGVVCLNTPFLKHELRASSTFLGAWMFICIMLGALIALLMALESDITVVALDMVSSLVSVRIKPTTLVLILFGFIGALAAVTLLNRKLLRARDTGEDMWGPRPRVLCLSCADDEAITFLGLGEGIANLPQLLFHPVALLIAIASTATALILTADVRLCPKDLACWASGSLAIGIGLIGWISIALVGGVLGSLSVAWLFGLDRKMFLESLVSRVLVSYVPLKPANTCFRAIVDLQTHWTPTQLLHSRIYQSKEAVMEMCGWIKKQRQLQSVVLLDDAA